ncbi:MAG: ABC transporter ATP-binding protein [Candidatus Obscuribacterales bacterium]|nr:ABC transporter ATP-binding protein [Candidatus Obscuribacterales bacterium]
MSFEQPAVEVIDLKKTYKGGNVCALNGISFTVPQGEIFGLIGPNGAGKTTLIGCLLALLQPDSGSLRIYGKPSDSISVRRITGYVPERADFEHWMTGRQFLEYHHGLTGKNAKSREADIDEALTMVELSESAWRRRLKTYSRGMLQRLNIAQLLIGKPQLALLDEPTLGLDPTGVKVVRNIVQHMRDTGITAIINSHQLDEVERLCDRVAFIKQGEIASVENIKSGTLHNYMLFVRWSENQLNGTLASVVSDAATKSEALVSECHHQWGRFSVTDHVAASRLIRELVARGVPVEEAVPERTKLEQLFSVPGGKTNHE